MMSAEKEACCVYMKDYSNVVVVFFVFFGVMYTNILFTTIPRMSFFFHIDLVCYNRTEEPSFTFLS